MWRRATIGPTFFSHCTHFLYRYGQFNRYQMQSAAWCRPISYSIKVVLLSNNSLLRWLQQAVRLGGRHNMPQPHLDFWPFDLEVGVGVACDLGYPCAKCRLPRPFGFRVRADIRQTDGRTDDGRRSPLNAPPPTGRGHNNVVNQHSVQ